LVFWFFGFLVFWLLAFGSFCFFRDPQPTPPHFTAPFLPLAVLCCALPFHMSLVKRDI
jgi:hypothetical protein